ncbi:MAG: CoA transferase [Bdellovibrionaceae bacterium]|nr:CoA transferase [Bdellovibrionales bacterium]MCB9084172.1 CoA transferase [Pseudobdellovibrionaceae bacterium]
MKSKNLQDLHLITLANNLPGPLALQSLMPLGIKVTKVEPPWGDPLNTHCSQWYREITSGQAILQLNLKEQGDKRRLEVLLEDADLLLSSFRPSALVSLGLDWTSLHGKYPHLSLVEIVGFSEDPEFPSHDLNYMARAGLLSPPTLPLSTFADILGSAQVATTILACLWQSGEAGTGLHRQVSLGDAAKTFARPLVEGPTQKSGPLGGAHPGYGIYATQDGWIALAALEPEFIETLKTEFNLKKLSQSALAENFASRASQDWEAWAQAKDIPLAAIPS